MNLNIGVVLLCLITCTAFGQERFGIAYSNYAPTNALHLHPSTLSNQKVFLDVNIVGLGIFVTNNYLYVPKSEFQFSDLLSRNPQLGDTAANRSSKLSKYGIVDAHVMGPAAALNWGDFGFGFHISSRSITNTNRMPADFANYLYDQPNVRVGYFGNSYQVEDARISHLSFSEIGLSGAYNWKKSGDRMISVGGTINYLVGHAGAVVKLSDVDFAISDSGLLHFKNGSMEVMHSNSGINQGYGVSTTLSGTYYIMTEHTDHLKNHVKQYGCKVPDYRFKASASLVDLGFVNFHSVNYRNVITALAEQNNLPITNIYVFQDFADKHASNIAGTVRKTNRIWLPKALALSADYQVKKHFFAGATYVHGMKPGSRQFGVERGKALNVNLRYERKHFEFALPITLYQFQQPQIGAMIRLSNNFVIGTDKLGTYLFNVDVYGADIFFNLKFGLFKNPECRVKSSRARKRILRNFFGGDKRDECPMLD